MPLSGDGEDGMRRLWLALIVSALVSGPALAGEAPSTGTSRATDAKKKTTKKSTRKRKKRSKKSTRKKASTKKKSKPSTVPVDIGIGPAFHWMTGPIQDDQAPHYGLKISLEAILDKETIQANKGRIPKKYRKLASGVEEARVTPYIIIPDTLYISPKTGDVGMYGIGWRPLGLGIPLLKVPRLAIGLGLDVTYIYIDGGDAGLGTTHFLRPGLDLQADLEIPFSKSFLVSVGWQSTFYPPQELGGDILAWGELEDSIWHIGQAYLMLHFRFPYDASL